MNRDTRLRLAALGALAPRPELAPDGLAPPDPAAALGVLRRQKTLGLVRDRLGRLAGSGAGPWAGALLQAVAPEAAAASARAGRLAAADAAVVALDRADTFLVKGLAFRSWYAVPDHRDVGDLDLWVPGAGQAWRLAAALRTGGWTYQDTEPPWFKRDLRTGEVYGQMRLHPPERDCDTLADIHFGPFYSVRHCAVIPLERPGSGRVAGSTDNLAMMVGNAANDYFVTMKDLNDLYLALDRDDVDWDRLRRMLRRAGLDGFLTVLVRRLRRFMDLDERREDALRRLAPPRRGEFPPPSLTEWGWRKRWWVTVRHARRTARSTPGLPVGRTVRAVDNRILAHWPVGTPTGPNRAVGR